MGSFILVALISTVAFLPPSLSSPSPIQFGRTERRSGKWSPEFREQTAVPSGWDVHFGGNVITTYVCRIIWEEESPRLRLGKFSRESHCCSYTLPNGTQACFRDSSRIEFLLKPEGTDGIGDKWIPAQDGGVLPQVHDGLVLGGLEDFRAELICRFEFVYAPGQILMLQGKIGVGMEEEECRVSRGFNDQEYGEVRSRRYELLVFA